jgi:type I restriction enzyme S subunit
MMQSSLEPTQARRKRAELPESASLVAKSLHIPAACGELLEGWTWCRLDDVSEGVFDCPHSTPKLTDTGPFVVRTQDIITGVFRADQAGRVSEETYAKRITRVTPSRGDLLYSREGTYFGIAAEVPPNTRVCLGQRMVLIRPDKRRLDFSFLCHWLNSPIMAAHINGYRDGTVAERLNLPTIRALPILIPPLAEQKAIAAVLGALDDKIELNRRMNATLEAIARALFQSWFIDFDPVRQKLDRTQNQPTPAASRHPLPMGEGRGEGALGLLDGRPPAALDPATAALFPEHLEESPLGHIPQGWTAGKFGDIGTNSRRGIQPSDIAPNTPYIALEHMPRRCIALGDWDDSADVASGKSAFKKGEILFGKLRPYFHKVGVAPFDGVCSTDILVLAPKSPEWFGFLLGHASGDELIQFTDLASTGTKMPRTNWGDISSFKVALPPKPIAAAFTHIIQPMLDRIHANLHQSHTLATLRDTLLPKLLSGELQTTMTP